MSPASRILLYRPSLVAALSVGTVSLLGLRALLRLRFAKVKQQTRRVRDKPLTKDGILEKREQFFCKAQSISYANSNPLLAMRAHMQYIYNETGHRYLDTRNNVGHVGWQHPEVVKAVQKQIAQCNANSRYIHPIRVTLAEKLLATFPEELSVCFFVNSGSEANDLALRLARTHTQNHDVICVDRAYHGHTVATLSISPYKYEHRGGAGKPSWVHQVACPDMYRGKHANLSPQEASAKYAAEVGSACAKAPGGRVAAFFVESGMSVAGVILPPPGYLKACYNAVRAAGGVCVADEVQTGFGRFGNHFWGFQQQEVVPDIVTMGKPFGNGVPLAAVVTTAKIAASFHNGLEYFNTFGGNPMSCAAGLAVLNVIESEDLQAHAKKVGNHIRKLVHLLMSRDAGQYIGDIRGTGLFLGIEFVRDRKTKAPATAVTSILCSRLKERHSILTSIDGIHNNVIVIKPPMCFSMENADTFLEKMELELGLITDADISNCTHTPT